MFWVLRACTADQNERVGSALCLPARSAKEREREGRRERRREEEEKRGSKERRKGRGQGGGGRGAAGGEVQIYYLSRVTVQFKPYYFMIFVDHFSTI